MASIVYRVDGGDPVTVNAPSVDVPVGVPPAAAAQPALAPWTARTPSTYYAVDVAGNRETTQSLTVNIDTSKPVTRAPRAAKVKRGRTASLKYEVRDATPNGGAAK